MTKIDIFSGFLGAGKTTLIRKLIKEAYAGQKIVLIENEFGEIAIDGGFLKDAGVEITEMNSGCICCTLVGDFKAALEKVIEDYAPDRIIIEPSGVGKLSDVASAVSAVAGKADIGAKVTVVDANKCKMYIRNFGEFFNDQVKNADVIVLSRTGDISEQKLLAAAAMLQELNSGAVVITTPWDRLSGEQFISAMEHRNTLAAQLEELEHDHEHHHHDDEDEHHECGCHDHEHHHHDDEDEHRECGCHDHEHHHHDDEDEHHECGCHDHEHHHHDDEDEHHECGCHDHEHHHHDDEDEHHECGCHDHEHHHHDDEDEHRECGCHDHEHHHHDDEDEHHECGCHDHEHHHHADEVFTSWGSETAKKFTEEQLKKILTGLDDSEKYGMVLRAKGMVDASDGQWLYFDYVPGEVSIRRGAPIVTGRFCVIGSKMNESALKELFDIE